MTVSLAVLGLGGGELIMVFAAILVLFGARKIPEFARGLGQAMKEFKKASREVSDEFNNAGNDLPSSLPPAGKPPSNPPPPSTVAKT